MRSYVSFVTAQLGRGRWQMRARWVEGGRPGRTCRNIRAGSKREAEAKARELFDGLVSAESARAAGSPALGAGAGGQSPTCLRAWLEGYVAMLSRTGRIEPTTASNYRASIKHILRAIDGDMQIAQVTPMHVVGMDDALLNRERLHPSTVAKAHRFLKQAFAFAVDAGLVVRTPFTRSVRPPRVARRTPNALDAVGRAELLEALARMGDTPLTVGVRLALCCGLRREEAIGLTWGDVDLERGSLRVRRAVVETSGGVVIEKDPKTADSGRVVPIEPTTLARLRAFKSLAQAEAQSEGVGWDESLYVLGDARGNYLRPKYLSHQFASLAEVIGLRGVTGAAVTYHDLRHTFATALISDGVDVKTVSVLMGHSSPTMTLTAYAAFDPANRATAAQAIARAMATAPLGGETVERARRDVDGPNGAAGPAGDDGLDGFM